MGCWAVSVVRLLGRRSQASRLTTPLIVFNGDRLKLNVDTSAVGDARVEIRGGDGTAVQGFSLADADMMQGNFIRRTVTWAGSDDVSTLRGQPIRLRFVMRGRQNCTRSSSCRTSGRGRKGTGSRNLGAIKKQR